MEQEQLIKLTLAAQIAGQIAGSYSPCKLEDSDARAAEIADLTMKIVNKLYERV